MKLQKPETQHNIPAVVIYNVSEGCDDAQAVIFMRDERVETSARSYLQASKRAARNTRRAELNGFAAA